MSVAALAADASGTWKWTQQFGGRGGGGGGGGGQPREITLTLEAKDGKVTGKLSQPGRDGNTNTVDISEGTVKGDEIAFNVEREFNGNKFVTKYAGKLEGDTIKGKIEMAGRGGQTRSVDWEAKRAK